MAVTFLVGFIVLGVITTNATFNASGAFTSSSQQYVQWQNFISYIWVAVSLLAITPLIMVILIFAGMFGQIGGGK
jgi:hypothetical protein